MEELLKALGYSTYTVLLILGLAYLGRNVLESFLEKQVERHKAELERETERLKTTLAVEAETYVLARRKRFEYLLDLWENSEALFEDTDFSSVASIKGSLAKVDESLRKLSRYAILLSPSLVASLREYLANVDKVLSNSENQFREGSVTPGKIGELLSSVSGGLGGISPELSLVTALAGALVTSGGKFLEDSRNRAAKEARQNLEEALRREFGIDLAQPQLLVAQVHSPAAAPETA